MAMKWRRNGIEQSESDQQRNISGAASKWQRKSAGRVCWRRLSGGISEEEKWRQLKISINAEKSPQRGKAWRKANSGAALRDVSRRRAAWRKGEARGNGENHAHGASAKS